MKAKQSRCCPHCFNNLAKKNSSAAMLWMELCDFFTKLHLLGGENFYEAKLNRMNEDNLWVIETNGFLVSTEVNDNLAIKLLGFNQGVFCVRFGRHE